MAGPGTGSLLKLGRDGNDMDWQPLTSKIAVVAALHFVRMFDILWTSGIRFPGSLLCDTPKGPMYLAIMWNFDSKTNDGNHNILIPVKLYQVSLNGC